MMAKPDKIEDLIKEIAAKNSIAVGRDDPIMILHTINERLIEDGQAAQKELLDQFKSELEDVAHRWGEDAKTKAERILNASLAASKEAMATGMQENSKRAADDLRKVVNESTTSIEKIVNGGRKAAIINLIASIFVIGSMIALLIIK